MASMEKAAKIAWCDSVSVVSVVRPGRYPHRLVGRVAVGIVMATMDVVVTVGVSVVLVVVIVRVPVMVMVHCTNNNVGRDWKTGRGTVQVGFSR